MGTLFGFVVGYVIGARAGSDSFDEVVDSLRQIRESDEFRSFVDVLRRHARGTASEVARRLSEEGRVSDDVSALLAKARARATGRDGS